VRLPCTRVSSDGFRLALPILTLVAAGLAGCGEETGGYIPVSEIAPNGFVSGQRAAVAARVREIRLWGYVDHGNLYGDADAKAILQEWWAGQGPDAGTRRFNLKAGANDAVGHSFPAHVPNDAGREDLLRRFRADARAGGPPKVFVNGRPFTFDAPTQARDLTGLYLELESSRDIRLAASDGE